MRSNWARERDLDREKRTPLLRFKYRGSISDAIVGLGRPDEIGRGFSRFQRHLYDRPQAARRRGRRATPYDEAAARLSSGVVGRDTASVRAFFGVRRWPDDAGTIDLGGRVLDVLPIPGHEASSIAVYHRRTGMLLTGDTFYPGRLYVRDTAAFARRIDRLAAFVRTHPVTQLLGAHVENSRAPDRDYPVGTVDQPDEHALELGRDRLFALDADRRLAATSRA